jgi:hypothetical protein
VRWLETVPVEQDLGQVLVQLVLWALNNAETERVPSV